MNNPSYKSLANQGNVSNVNNSKKLIFQHFQKSAINYNQPIDTSRKSENLQKLNGDDDNDEKMLDQILYIFNCN